MDRNQAYIVQVEVTYVAQVVVRSDTARNARLEGAKAVERCPKAHLQTKPSVRGIGVPEKILFYNNMPIGTEK